MKNTDVVYTQLARRNNLQEVRQNVWINPDDESGLTYRLTKLGFVSSLTDNIENQRVKKFEYETLQKKGVVLLAFLSGIIVGSVIVLVAL